MVIKVGCLRRSQVRLNLIPLLKLLRVTFVADDGLNGNADHRLFAREYDGVIPDFVVVSRLRSLRCGILLWKRHVVVTQSRVVALTLKSVLE